MRRSGIKLIVAGLLAIFGPLVGLESRAFGTIIPVGIVAVIIGCVFLFIGNNYSGGGQSAPASNSGSEVFGSAYNKEN